MKRYLFLKLGIAILVCTAAASPRSQFSENIASNRDENRQKNVNQNGVQKTPDAQQGDTNNNLKDYQGVMGKPGVDFPVLTYIPRTKFTCRGKKSGYYADLETNCQVFHICDEGRKVSFLCPNGTIFQQSDLICDWWFKVDCESSPNLYNESAEQLYEENIKRKENRRVQQEQRRAEQRSKINNSQNENSRQGREFNKQRSQVQAQRNDQPNYTKKDVNHITSDQHLNKYNENSAHTARNDYTNNYKETQIPSETASFVSSRYNNGESKNYYKNVNDIGTNTPTYLPPKLPSNEFGSVKTTTEKIVNRGGRTFNTATTGDKGQYRNQVSDFQKTTTQHTIYSPTVPPFTSTRYTTRAPSTLPISSTTRAFESRIISTTRGKSLSGFYITKQLNPITTTSPVTITEPVFITTTTEKPTTTYSYQENVFTNPTYAAPIDSSTSTTQTNVNDLTAQTDNLHTTPASVSQPVIASEIITGADKFSDSTIDGFQDKTDTVYSRFGSTQPIAESTTFIPTTEQQDITEKLPSTKESLRNPKQYDFSPDTFEQFSEKNTILPSVPTPFRIQTESSTERIRSNTYLPKATDGRTPTPRPTIPTEYTTYVTAPPVTDNLSNMIKTLQELEGENPAIEVDKYLGSRPGLNIPPSAGPKTLHSLAIYFATALDNLVTNDTTDRHFDDDETTTVSTVDDVQVTLLSRTTLNKYNSLFNEKHAAESNINNENVNITNTNDTISDHEDDLDLRSLIEHDAQFNDLDSQQSRGFVSSTPRVRQLAQVFTQALSAYLDDPDTFKKVLEEIRPTEPPLLPEETTEITSYGTTTVPTTTTTTTTTEYRSYTKEEDEVLDFSDVDKSSTYKPFSDNSISSTQPTLYARSTAGTFINDISSQTPLPTVVNLSSPAAFTSNNNLIPTPNPIALVLNNGLKLANSSALQDIESSDESSTEDNTESDDYFPFPTGEDEADIRLKSTAQPYGFDVKPVNSTPISTIPQIPPSAETWNDIILNNNQTDNSKLSDSLLPPFKVSLLNDLEETNSSFLANEEYLQSAHSQSFISHSNSISSDREGKSFDINSNGTSYSTAELPKSDTTVFTTDASNNNIYTSTPTPATTSLYEVESATQFFASRHSFDETTTASPILSTNTDAVVPEITTNSQYTTTYTPKEYTSEQTTYTPKDYDYTTAQTTYTPKDYTTAQTTYTPKEYTTAQTYTSKEYTSEQTTYTPKEYTSEQKTYTSKEINTQTTYTPKDYTSEQTTYTPKEYTNAPTTYTPKEYASEQTTYFSYKYTTESPTHSTNEYTSETTTHVPYTSPAYTTTTISPEQTTNTKVVPENHWSTSPEVTKLWESTLYVDPLLINRKFEQRFSDIIETETNTVTTDSPDIDTEHYSRHTTEEIDENIIDLRFASTTNDYSTATAFTTLPPTITNEPNTHTTVIDLGIHSLLNSTELEIASSQAHQIFGNLDTAEQDLLIEKMKEADSNSTVRRLILLLVSTCDASLSNNKTVQETRKSILHALLNLPSNNDADKLDGIHSRSGKQITINDELTVDSTTTISPETTTSHSDELSNQSSAILPTIEIPNKSLDVTEVNEDTRALELLRSLYSLAAKWGKK